MTTKLRIGFTLIGFLALTAMTVFASEQPGPGGSVGRSGGGSGGPSGKGGVPEGQAPVDPMQEGAGTSNQPDPDSGKGTQNPKQEAGKKSDPSASDKVKGKK